MQKLHVVGREQHSALDGAHAAIHGHHRGREVEQACEQVAEGTHFVVQPLARAREPSPPERQCGRRFVLGDGAGHVVDRKHGRMDVMCHVEKDTPSRYM